MSDLISRQEAIDALDKIFPADPMRNDYTQGITCGAALATEYIKQLPSAQPQRTGRLNVMDLGRWKGMTNEEAIKTLEANYPDACFEQLREAVDAAIEALKAQDADSDTISRKAAIDAILAVTGNSSVRELYEHVQEHGLSDMWSGGVNAAIDIIIAVPPVQPEQCADTISRQTAIDALWKALHEYEDKTEKQFQESEDLDVEDWILHRIFVQNMSDIDRQTILNLPSAQPTEASCWGCNCQKMERLKEQKTFSEMVHLHDAETHEERTETHACDLISRQWLMECVNEGWIKFDTEKDKNRFIHLVRDIAPSAQPDTEAEIQKIQDLEQAQMDKAYELGYEEGKVSAQPDIVACGDCKHWICHDRRCGYWNHGVRAIDWCSHAERRTDEHID